MKIGVLKKIKDNENRVAATPVSIEQLVRNDYQVLVETNASLASGYTHEEVGAKIVDAKKSWDIETVMKKKGYTKIEES